MVRKGFVAAFISQFMFLPKPLTQTIVEPVIQTTIDFGAVTVVKVIPPASRDSIYLHYFRLSVAPSAPSAQLATYLVSEFLLGFLARLAVNIPFSSLA